MNLNWDTNPTYRKGCAIIRTLDTHTAGEPLRIVIDGMPALSGATILERRRFMQQHYDHLRKMLMWEPRGHYNMYGCILTPPVSPEADLGVLFMHNEGYSTMCGHGTIGLVTALIETGALPSKGKYTPVNLDTPAGLVRATAHLDEQQHVESVSFLNVPSFLYARNAQIDVPLYGPLTVDIAYGGAFYVIVPSSAMQLNVQPSSVEQLVQAGEAIKRAVNAQIPVNHPLEPDISFVYGTIFTDHPEDPSHHSRNVCIFADGEVDRSPTGTGVSARLALHYAKDEIAFEQAITIESILGASSVFRGRIIEQAKVGSFDAIVPEVSGSAFITGRHEFILDPHDKVGGGFLMQ